MKTKAGKLTSVACALTLVLGMTACSPGADEEAEGSSLKQKVTIAANAQPPTIDVQLTTVTSAVIPMRNVYEQLVTYNEDLEPTPMLAEEVTESKDGKSYLFQLREGVTFHNGKEMTSEDVVASMNRWRQVNSKAIQYLPGAKFASKGKYSVEMKLKKRTTETLDFMASQGQMSAIMPKELVPKGTTTQVEEFVGTGPYKFTEWKKDQYIHLQKYEDYKDNGLESSGTSGAKPVSVKDLYFRFIADPSTRIAGVRSGQYDIASNIPGTNYKSLKEQKNVKTYTEPSGQLVSIFNRRSGLSSDLKVRQAINAAMDSKAVMETAFSGEDLVHMTSSYMPEKTRWATDAGKDEYNQNDPERAKKLLKEAGYKGQTVRILSSKDYDYMYKASVVIQQQLEAIGMKVKLEVTDYATLTEKRAKDDGWDLAMSSFLYNSTPSQLFAVSDSFAGAVADVPERDNLLKDLRSASSPEKAEAVWADFQTYIWTDYLPFVFFGDFDDVFIGTDKVKELDLSQGVLGWNLEVEK